MSSVPNTNPLARAFDESSFPTQLAFARRLRVSEAQVSRWLNGLIPPVKYRERIAKALEVDVDTLWPEGHDA